jgi:hypothetical protein
LSIAQPQPAEQPTIPRVKVKVNMSRENGATVTCSHPVGSPNDICQHFQNNKLRTRAEYYAIAGYDLRQCIMRTASTITSEQWSHAIASEIIFRISNRPEADVELCAIAQGGYLALDHGIYRLTPVEMAPQSKALRAIHRHALDKAKVAADRLIVQANAQVSSIVSSANTKMLEANALLAEAKANTQVAPPKWALPYQVPLRWHNDHRLWCIGITAHIILTKFTYKWASAPEQYTIKTWNAIPQPATPTLLWVPLQNDKEEYSQIAIFVDAAFNDLPHISKARSCMAITSLPPKLSSVVTIATLTQRISEVMRVVELDSLLKGAINWHPNLQAAIPPSIQAFVLAGAISSVRSVAANHTEEISAETEANSTFTAPARG